MAQAQQLCQPSQTLPAWENQVTPRVGEAAGLGLGEGGAGPWTAQGQSGLLRDRVAILHWDTTSISRSSLRALGSIFPGKSAGRSRSCSSSGWFRCCNTLPVGLSRPWGAPLAMAVRDGPGGGQGHGTGDRGVQAGRHPQTHRTHAHSHRAHTDTSVPSCARGHTYINA